MKKRLFVLILAAAPHMGGARDLAAQERVFYRAQQLRECGRLGISVGPAPVGITIQELIPGSPADRAGLEPGDRVVRLNGEPADPVRLDILARTLRPGDRVRVEVMRADTRREVDIVAARDLCAQQVVVTPDPEELRHALRELRTAHDLVIRMDTLRIDLDTMRARLLSRQRMALDSMRRRMESEWSVALRPGRLPRIVVTDDERSGSTFEWFEIGQRAVAGAEFSELNPGLAQYFEGTREGLLVLNVAPGTPGERAGLRPGDIVVGVDDRAVRSVRELRLHVIRADRNPATLDVVRKGERLRLRLPNDPR